MNALPNETAARRESSTVERIPCAAHVSATVVKTLSGDYVQVMRLGGASFECADDEQLNTWHERLNVLWRNIASPQVSLWTHIVRRREVSAVTADSGDFAGALERKYRGRLAGQKLMVNELYLSTVYRPTTGVATTLAARVLKRTQASGSALELADALEACEKLRETVRASLARYEPELLGVYAKGGRAYSGVLNFLSTLVNGEVREVLLPRAPIGEVLATSRVSFGTEALEYRLPAGTRSGAMLGIKEYPTPTHVGMFDPLLSAPFPFVLTQSFTFLTKASGQALLQRQFNRMVNAGDFAVSQAEELKDALDALTSNEFVMGDHHFSLQVMADDTEDPLRMRVALSGSELLRRTDQRTRDLSDHVALARAVLADTGMTVAREDLALEAAFWAQLPGNFPMRPRKAPITSRNFAAMVPFHNYPAGRARGNHWGDALTVLVTSARSPFHFSLHASDPTDPEGGSRKDTGPHPHLRPHRIRQDRLHRVSGDSALASGRDADSLRQGPGARDSGTGAGRGILCAEKRRADGIQSAQAPAHPHQYRVSEELAAGDCAPHTGGAHRTPAGRSRFCAARNTGASTSDPAVVKAP